jgi:hypothetical protein
MFGPAIQGYHDDLKPDESTSDNLNEKRQTIPETMENKYPLLRDLTSGSKGHSIVISNSWSVGFLYGIQTGFRF